MIVYLIFIFIFGLLIGSFLNVVILRLPEGKSIVLPRSSCSNCGHQIKWFENIPLLSYLYLRGKCSNCSTKISIQYPIIEFISGLAALYFLKDCIYGPTQLIHGILFFTIFCVFLAHFVIDLRHYLLLDSLNIYLAIIFVFYGVFYLQPISMILGAVIGGGLPYLVTWLFYKIKGKVGLGGGDIKLWSVLGLYLGPIGIIHNIWLSCSLGAIVGLLLIGMKFINKDQPIPFGPFIIVIASLQIFFKDAFYNFLSFML